MALWFVEEQSHDDRWIPCTYRSVEPPQRHTSGDCHRVFRADPVKVSTDHDRLTLTQLREVYAQDGKFQAAQKCGAESREDACAPIDTN